MKTTLIILVACLAGGCMSFHKHYERTLVAHIEGTKEAASGYPVKIEYPYDCYTFYLRYWNEPSPIETNLNSQGEVTVTIADFWDPYLVVGSTRFRLKSDTLLHGGKIDPLQYQPDVTYPKVNVELKQIRPSG